MSYVDLCHATDELLVELRVLLLEKYPGWYCRFVSMSPTRGWLRGFGSCMGNTDMCVDIRHYHSFDITGMHFGTRDDQGHFISPYQLWEYFEDNGLIPMETEGEWYQRTGIKPPMSREEAEEFLKKEGLF